MDEPTDELPTPIIDLSLCDGCGLCVRACPNRALTLAGGKAVVPDANACDYSAYCTMICPTQAISHAFQIIVIS